jgi:bifunctional oligoribonuclease and PAP phosphatase NrnA
MNVTDFGPVIDAIHRGRRFLVASHVDPEGDSLGSQLALAQILDELGKEVSVVNQDRPPARFDFMPGIRRIQPPAAVASERFDAAFVVDCASLERIGNVRERLNGVEILNLDHHRSNTRFGAINYIQPETCASGMIVYELNEALGLPLTADKATNMYVGIISDTGNFRYSNTSPEVLRVGSRLIETGIDSARIASLVFATKSQAALRLLGEALTTLTSELGGKVGLIVLDRQVFARTGAEPADVEGIVNYAKQLAGTDVGVLLREVESGEVKASLRAEGAVDVDRVASHFGGGGHKNAAGARLPGPLPEARRRLLAELERAIFPSDGNGAEAKR